MTLPQRIKIAEQLVHRLEWSDMDFAALRRFAERAWSEADPGGIGRSGAGSRHRTVDLVAEGDLSVCGSELVPVIASVSQLREGCRAWLSDGQFARAGVTVASLEGPENLVRIAAETARTMIRRLSGIAALARAHTTALGDGRTRLLDNGEFTPGWRMLEKYALACGGAWDGGSVSARIRIESHNLDATEIEARVRRARESTPDIPVEVTVRDGDEIAGAGSASVDLIRLEEFPLEKIRAAVAAVNGRAFVEAHGDITVANIGDYAGLGLDFVSVKGLVSEARWAPLAAVWRD